MTLDIRPPQDSRSLGVILSSQDYSEVGEVPPLYTPLELQIQVEPLHRPVVEVQAAGEQPRQSVLDHLLARISASGLISRQYAEQYLRDQYRRGCRPNTMRGTTKSILMFLEFVMRSGKTDIEQISRQDIYGFLEHEQDRGMKPRTVVTRLQCVKAFLRFLIDADVLEHRLLSRRMSVKVPESLPRAMDPEDVRSLLEVVTDVRDRAIILVLLRTGMRIGELLSTRVSEVNLSERKIEIFEAEKTRVGRVVYLSEDAHVALKAWFKQRDARKERLIYAMGRKSMSYAGARAVFEKYVKMADLESKGYSLHCLRHTFASELLNAGVRLECVQQLLGHRNIEMTRRYARLTDKTREEEYFRAMSIIERGDMDGHYRVDHQLQAVSKEKELLDTLGEELHEHP
jgi:integrase/recombinase XerD